MRAVRVFVFNIKDILKMRKPIETNHVATIDIDTSKKLENMFQYDSPSALVLGIGVNGLGIIRGLAQEGIKTIGLYNSNEEAGRFSRFSIPIRCPDVNNEEKLLHFLLVEEQIWRQDLNPDHR